MPLLPVRGADGGTYQLEYVSGPGGGLVPATPVDGDQLGQGGGTSSSSSQQLVAQNTGRRRIDISNAGDSDVWLRFGSGSAIAGEGTLLPGRAQGTYYTTARVAMINEAGGSACAIGFTEWA